MRGRWLNWGGRIDRYVGSLFLSSYATAFLLVVGLFLILDMASNLDDYLDAWADGTRAPTLLIARYYLLQVPFVFLQVAPFITLVAGLFTVSRLLKHHETIAALAAGVSAHRLLAPIFLMSAGVAAGMFGLREALAFDLANKRDAVRFVLENKKLDRVYPHLWLRDLNGSFVHLTQFRPSVGDPPVAEARGIDAIVPSTGQSIEAARAVWVERNGRTGWWLEGGVYREVRPDQTRVERPLQMLEGFDFTPALALSYYRARENPLELSFSEVRELMRRDPDRAVYQTMFQYSLTFPLANLVLLLVGLPILLRHERGKGAEGLAAGCLLCVFYFAVDFVFRNLGLQSSMDPRYAAWLPVLFFGSLGLVLYDSMRT
ncbi:MAG: LptF/LptG family permease [Planctomycetota bacterium]